MPIDEQNYYLSTSEISEISEILNLAIENHRKWFDTLHRSIIFNQDFPKDILDEVAHTKCQFRKWYYGNLSQAFRQYEEFNLLESSHRYMHYYARVLSQAFLNNETPSIDIYNKFISFQKEVIRLLQALHDKLINLGHGYDSLTGLLNRNSITLILDNAYEKSIRHRTSYSVAMIDADHFKKINDTYGHSVGDDVLKTIANHMRISFRKSDCIGRIGGEEFLVVLSETEKEEARKILEKYRESLSNLKINSESIIVNATVSIGISQVSQNDEDSWQAVKRADYALYNSKENGRNRITVSE